MRQYLSVSNLWQAMTLGVIVTVMAVPRILHARMDAYLYVPAAFLAMTLLGGAGTAWGTCGGMIGLLPGKRRLLTGMAVAFALAMLLIPLQLLWLDPALASALARLGDTEVIRLRFPSTTSGRLALMLWVAGFETVFFQVGGMSFFARLSGNQWISMAAVSTFRLFVSSKYLAQYGITESVPLFMVSAVLCTALSCVLYARAGLTASMVFGAMLNLHLFFYDKN